VETTETKYRYCTVNTNNIRGANVAIAMKRNGWELVEVRDFWTIKFRKKKIQTK
jgi:hypothetical protein